MKALRSMRLCYGDSKIRLYMIYTITIKASYKHLVGTAADVTTFSQGYKITNNSETRAATT